MRTPIPDGIVEEAWMEVTRTVDPKPLAEHFSEKQPGLSVLLSEATEGLSAEAVELGYFAALVVWRCFERARGDAIRPVEPSELVDCYRRNEDWLERAGANGAILLDKMLRDTRRYAEPDVMRFVVEAVFDAHEDGIELSSAEQERLFMVLKVITECLSRAAS